MKKQLSQENLFALLQNEAKYRHDQIIRSIISGDYQSFLEISTLSQKLREKLDKEIFFSSVYANKVISTSNSEVHKAVLKLYDDSVIETVLMKNLKGNWTICLSSQVGCSIKCSFCSTGTLGFKRNLDLFEIIEQVVFWIKYIKNNLKQNQRISNLVVMGMGEPLLNYENIKDSLNYIIKFSDIGPNYITVSTIGILPVLQKLLTDPDWPSVKIAISIHSANNKVRKEIVPIHSSDFFKTLKNWCHKYTTILGARTRPLTFEYVMLKGINDTTSDARDLVQFLKTIKRVKVNLIPYNEAVKNVLATKSTELNNFQNILKKAKITTTIRKSMGQDIQGACGQLAANTF